MWVSLHVLVYSDNKEHVSSDVRGTKSLVVSQGQADSQTKTKGLRLRRRCQPECHREPGAGHGAGRL